MIACEDKENSPVFPGNLVSRYKELMGDEWLINEQILLSPTPTTVRINTLKTSIASGLARLHLNGWDPVPIAWLPGAFRVAPSVNQISSHPDILLGYFYLQGAASMLPPSLLDPQPTHNVLDLCAAPGSKTTQMAAMMKNQGTIIANEPSITRIRALNANLQKTGTMNTIILRLDGRFIPSAVEPCDRILVDSPCSSLGTLRKNPRLLSNYEKNFFLQYATLQKGLLTAAYRALKPGGVLVYSTCSIEPEENELVIDHLINTTDAQVVRPSLPNQLKYHDGLTKWLDREFSSECKKTVRLFPSDNNTIAFFIGLVKKPQNSWQLEAKSLKPPKPFPSLITSPSEVEIAVLKDSIQKQYGITTLPPGKYFKSGKYKIWVISESSSVPIRLKSRIETLGLYVGQFDMSRFRLSMDAAIMWKPWISKTVSFSGDEMKAWLSGVDVQPVSMPSNEGNFVVLRHQDDILGCGLAAHGIVRNYTPKSRRSQDKPDALADTDV